MELRLWRNRNRSSRARLWRGKHGAEALVFVEALRGAEKRRSSTERPSHQQGLQRYPSAGGIFMRRQRHPTAAAVSCGLRPGLGAQKKERKKVRSSMRGSPELPTGDLG